MSNVLLSPTLPLERWALGEFKRSLHVAYRSCVSSGIAKKAKCEYAQNHISFGEELLFRRIGTMAIDRKSGKDFEFLGWVNIRLGEQDKAQLAAMSKTVVPVDLVDWIATMTFNGYSFSVSWDDYSDAQQVSIVCKNAQDTNFGYGLSARHPELLFAILSLRYKHTVIADFNWNEAPSPTLDNWG
jgi:hypothetical protein